MRNSENINHSVLGTLINITTAYIKLYLFSNDGDS